MHTEIHIHIRKRVNFLIIFRDIPQQQIKYKLPIRIVMSLMVYSRLNEEIKEAMVYS